MCDDLSFNRGSYAEYVRVPARIVSQNMFKLPDSMSHKTASLMKSFACAVCGIENCPMEPGDFVVINRAGPIGLMSASLAVLKGAQVLVTDISQGGFDVAERLGVWGTLNLQLVGDSVSAVRKLTDDQRGTDVSSRRPVSSTCGRAVTWRTRVDSFCSLAGRRPEACFLSTRRGCITRSSPSKGCSTLHPWRSSRRSNCWNSG